VLARKETVEVTFGRPQMSSMTSDSIHHLHFDQLKIIAHHVHTVRTGKDQWRQEESIKRTGDNNARKGLAIPKLL
jgi:hypothetical protein